MFALDHLENCEHSPPVDIILIHPGFNRPYLIVKPVHECHIICIAAQQCHRCMGMGIDKARNSQPIRSIDDLAGMKARRNFTNRHNIILIDHDIRQWRRAIRQNGVNILDQCLHK